MCQYCKFFEITNTPRYSRYTSWKSQVHILPSIPRHCLTCNHKPNSIWACFPYSFIFFCIKSACSDIQDLHYFFSSWYLLQLHWEKHYLFTIKNVWYIEKNQANVALREMKYYDLLYCKSFWLENPFSKV